MTPIAIIGMAWGVLKFVINEPIVNKAVDNWTKGTTNKIDDMVWSLVERLAGVTDETVATLAREGVAEIQTVYNAAKEHGKLAEMKQDRPIVDVAAVYTDGKFRTDNIG